LAACEPRLKKEIALEEVETSGTPDQVNHLKCLENRSKKDSFQGLEGPFCPQKDGSKKNDPEAKVQVLIFEKGPSRAKVGIHNFKNQRAVAQTHIVQRN